jgi:hypothetical protein
MPRKVLGTLQQGGVYTFQAGSRSSGTVNVAWDKDALPGDRTSIHVVHGDDYHDRRDRIPAGTNRLLTMGPYTDIASIENVGPSRIHVSLSW